MPTSGWPYCDAPAMRAGSRPSARSQIQIPSTVTSSPRYSTTRITVGVRWMRAAGVSHNPGSNPMAANSVLQAPVAITPSWAATSTLNT